MENDEKKRTIISGFFGFDNGTGRNTTGRRWIRGTDTRVSEKIHNFRRESSEIGKPIVGVENGIIQDVQDREIDAIRVYIRKLHSRYMGEDGYYLTDVCIPSEFDDVTQLICLLRAGLQRRDGRTRIDQFESFQCTKRMSISHMSAPIQMHLVAVYGSKEVPYGNDADEFDEEFSSITSRFQSGKASLDISLQTDKQSKTLKT